MTCDCSLLFQEPNKKSFINHPLIHLLERDTSYGQYSGAWIIETYQCMKCKTIWKIQIDDDERNQNPVYSLFDKKTPDKELQSVFSQKKEKELIKLYLGKWEDQDHRYLLIQEKNGILSSTHYQDQNTVSIREMLNGKKEKAENMKTYLQNETLCIELGMNGLGPLLLLKYSQGAKLIPSVKMGYMMTTKKNTESNGYFLCPALKGNSTTNQT